MPVVHMPTVSLCCFYLLVQANKMNTEHRCVLFYAPSMFATENLGTRNTNFPGMLSTDQVLHRLSTETYVVQ